MTARCNTAKLYEVLDAKREANDLSWRDVAKQAGIGTGSIFTRLGQGHAPSAHNLAAMLIWLGHDAFWITKDREAP